MRDWFFLDEQMSEARELALAAGTVCVFSARSPERETPNEDGAAVFELDDGSLVLAVADGAGGHRAGNQAAEAALRALGHQLAAWSSADEERVRNAVLDGIERANADVVALGLGAATTIAVAQIREHRVRPYHAGDSPILVLGQRGRLKLSTTAHSPTGYAVEAGVLEEESALHHEDRHVVSNLLGTEGMHIELGAELALAPRDTLLLASDGLTDNLRIEEIVELVRSGPPGRAIQGLGELCRERMSRSDPQHPSKPDDLTIALFRRSAPRRG